MDIMLGRPVILLEARPVENRLLLGPSAGGGREVKVSGSVMDTNLAGPPLGLRGPSSSVRSAGRSGVFGTLSEGVDMVSEPVLSVPASQSSDLGGLDTTPQPQSDLSTG